MSPAHVIKIGKTKWLAGLTWRSFEDTPNKADIESDAEQLNADWYSTRIGEAAIQCGFGNPPAGHEGRPDGLYSLAAMLADSQQEPWLGIFKIDEGLWWYIAVRDGHAILPNGDQVGDQDVIVAAREQHSGFTDWHYIEGNIDDLADRINAVKAKKTPIRTLKGGKYSPVAMGITAAIVVSVLGGYFWWQHQTHAAMQARLAAMAKMRMQLAHQAPPPPPSPLLRTPAASTWLAACRESIDSTPLSLDGWQLFGTTCTGSAVTVTWKRGPGATVAKKPDGELSDNNTMTTTIPFFVPNGKNDAIQLTQAKTMLIAGLQKSGIDLQTNQAPAIPVLPGAPASSAIAPPAQVLFAFDTALPVFDLNLDIPGLRLNKISSTQSGGWHVEGVLYGK